MKAFALLLGLCASFVASAAEFATVVPGYAVEFPRDEGMHPDFRTEWWYVTGWLERDSGEPLGFQILGPREGANASSITTFRHERASSTALFAALEKADVVASLRHDREGRDYLRFSPHCYNSEKEIDTAVDVIRAALG